MLNPWICRHRKAYNTNRQGNLSYCAYWHLASLEPSMDTSQLFQIDWKFSLILLITILSTDKKVSIFSIFLVNSYVKIEGILWTSMLYPQMRLTKFQYLSFKIYIKKIFLWAWNFRWFLASNRFGFVTI